MLVANHISSPSPISIHDPTIISSSTTFDPFVIFFPTIIRLQNFQDHEPYPLVTNLNDFQFDPPYKKQKSTKGRVAKKSYDNNRKFQIEWATKMP